MKLKQGVTLPSFIMYGEMEDAVQVFCDSADRVCFRCLRKGHIAPYCRNRAKLASQIQPGVTSWAAVVQSGCPQPPKGPLSSQVKDAGVDLSPSGLRDPPLPAVEVDPSPQGLRDPSITCDEGELANEEKTHTSVSAEVVMHPLAANQRKPDGERKGRAKKAFPPPASRDPPTLGPNATAYAQADEAWHKVVGSKSRGRDSSGSSVASQKRARPGLTVTNKPKN